MIIVMAEYDLDYQVPHPRLPIVQIPYFYDESLFGLRDVTESVVGDVFSEEQDRVEVRMVPFGLHDNTERPLFFTIDVSEDTVHHDLDGLAKQFIVEMKNLIPDLPPFRVWVRRISGSFTETN